MRRYGGQKWRGHTKTSPPKDATVLGTLGRLPWEIIEVVLVFVVRAQGPLLLTGGRCAGIQPRIGTGLLAVK